MARKEYINGYYDGETDAEGRPNGHGIKYFRSGIILEGEFKDGKANGPSITTFPDGRRLETEYVDGIISGEAKWYRNDELFGEGNYLNGKMAGLWIYDGKVHSEGIYENGKKNGTWIYECDAYRKEIEYRDNVKRGPMKIEYEDGTVTAGEYDFRGRTGRWTDTFPDGTCIERNYKKDKEWGNWIINHPDGSKTKLLYHRGWVKGEVKSVTAEGTEIPYLSDGYSPCFMKRPVEGEPAELTGRINRITKENDLYEGQVNEMNDPHGYGTRYNKTGTIYNGHFKDGAEDGPGNVYFTNGLRLEANRTAGEKNGHGRMYFGDWMFSEGEFRNDKKTGHWVNYMDAYYEGDYLNGEKNGLFITDDDESVSEIEYSGGIKNGPCTITYKNGMRSVGGYHDGLESGHWVNYYPDGTCEEGRYKRGMKEGPWTIYQPDGEAVMMKFHVGSSSGRLHNVTKECGDAPIGFNGKYSKETDSIEASGKKKGLFSGIFKKK